MEVTYALSLLQLLACICASAHALNHGRKLRSYPQNMNPPTVGNELSTLGDTSPPRSKSEKKCEEYSRAVFSYLPGQKDPIDNCYNKTVPLVVKGENAKPREFPHMALIGFGANKARITWWCGGSLISERFVLSAAHCSDTGNNSLGVARWVRLGEYSLSSTDDDDRGLAQSEDYAILERHNHPSYTGKGLRYDDIALFRLDRKVRFNEFVRPACLHAKHAISETVAIITGWGHTEWRAHTSSDILQKAKIPIVPIQSCKDDWNYTITLLHKNTDGIRENTQICAGNTTEGVDSCQGDSGGPLQISLDGIHYCMNSVIGVTSFGTRCAGNEPSLYTRVSHYVPWIESVVWP